MIRKMRFFSMVAILMAVLAINVMLPAAALASDTPCTDAWAGCIAGGGGDAFCDGLWCGCMYANYGYICQLQAQ